MFLHQTIRQALCALDIQVVRLEAVDVLLLHLVSLAAGACVGHVVPAVVGVLADVEALRATVLGVVVLEAEPLPVVVVRFDVHELGVYFFLLLGSRVQNQEIDEGE